jgi:hypothetical protein
MYITNEPNYEDILWRFSRKRGGKTPIISALHVPFLTSKTQTTTSVPAIIFKKFKKAFVFLACII